jgi:NAD-dependent dihydropyrimidine dehydrogenase PreA subunit
MMNEQTWLPIIDRATCTGCADCVEVCPTGALALQDNLAIVAVPEACSYCGYCEPICPVGAIALPYEIVWEED